ncbi:MAG: TIGR04053 family radical SAM/SPASM domain-containing protein [Candidatus Omnitrophica bacterium]|nr:TIGR04053 family radical SAM/SPASM domain-containing protein [Candidatus Omnitrophota bacterium]
MNFDGSPFIVIWETTQACDLACAHCRAEAQPLPLPGELTPHEGLNLIDQIAALDAKICVLSGGDPLKRSDLTALIRHGKQRGLRMGTIPAATPRLTESVVRDLKAAGLDQMALSLDFSAAEAHDRFRGVEGAFAKVIEAVDWAHRASLPLQINTVVSALNVRDLDGLIALVQRLGIVFWEVFFLVPVGRGNAVPGLAASQYEEVFARLYTLSRTVPFLIKVTEGMHYRRFCLQRQRAEGFATPSRNGYGPHGSIGISPQSVNAGKGHVFISSVGDVYPSGFLPLSVGNIRQSSLAQLYREAPVMHELRQPNRLKGRCGVCEFRTICGGSRARAYALTGDYLAEDPSCTYQSVLHRAVSSSTV